MSLKDYELVGDSPRRFMDSVGAPCIPHTNSGVKLGKEAPVRATNNCTIEGCSNEKWWDIEPPGGAWYCLEHIRQWEREVPTTPLEIDQFN